MRWTLNEFLWELKNDPTRRVLFVEGTRDLTFWRHVIPHKDRGDTTIYCIDSINCPDTSGGERGRLIQFAREIEKLDLNERVRFFADADCDRILKISLPSNVFLTDGRDLESYALITDIAKDVCSTCTTDENSNAIIDELIADVARPIGVLRITSARRELMLPFQKSIHSGKTPRFLTATATGLALNLAKLLEILLQNAGMSLSHFTNILGEYEKETVALEAEADYELVHGKDLIRIMAIAFDLSNEHCSDLIALAMRYEIDVIRALPNLRAAETWVRPSLH